MTKIGSARISENGTIYGIAGDQKQTSAEDMSGEVSQQEFYLHKKGWIVLRAKDKGTRKGLALSMRTACNNPMIGYSQADRYGVVKHGTSSTVPCNADCSSLVRRCVLEASGIDPGDFNTATEVKTLMRTGLFDKLVYVKGMDLKEGDILVTQTKGHTAIVTQEETSIEEDRPTNYRFGIDVAKWQGVIDWAKVKTSGHGDFAVLKCTKKNNQIEDSFARNYAGAEVQNIPIAVYRYVYAKSVGQAVEEANGIIAALRDRYIEGEVWLDMEDSSIRNIGKAALTVIIDTEADILKAHGYKVGIYCNTDWYYHVLDGAQLATKYKFWIAKFGKNTGNGSWQNREDDPSDIAYAWQYTSKGVVPGITGNVDLDLIY